MITLPAMRGLNILSVTLSDWSVCRESFYSTVLMGDRIEYVNGRDYLRTGITAWGSPSNWIMVSGKRLRIQPPSSTDNLGDMNRCVCVTISKAFSSAGCWR